MPTHIENQELNKLFLYIYFNDRDKVAEFKNQKPEIYAKKHKYLIDRFKTFDLTNLTLLNHRLWFNNIWDKEIQPLINENQQRTNQMLEFWETNGEKSIVERKIEYNQYCDYFYCDDPNDPESNEEIMLEQISYFLKKGFREIDLKLYNRIECFDFIEAKNLLEKGARTDIHFCEDNDSDANSRIYSEVSFLASCHVIPEFESFKEKGYRQNYEIISMFGELLGLIAHLEMAKLISKYNK
jgi:hypothetical protein